MFREESVCLNKLHLFWIFFNVSISSPPATRASKTVHKYTRTGLEIQDKLPHKCKNEPSWPPQYIAASPNLNRIHGVYGESGGCQAAWGAGQQGHLCVRRPAVADGAVMLPGPSGQVPSELPPPPSPPNLMLHLLMYTDQHMKSSSTFLMHAFDARLCWSYLSVQEAVENSHHETLGDGKNGQWVQLQLSLFYLFWELWGEAQREARWQES